MDVMIRVFKSWGARDPERRWVNNYEAHDNSAVGPEDFKLMLDQIVLGEKAIHLEEVQFLSATISTWEPDSKPYDPTAFFTYELTGPGQRALAQPGLTALDSNVVLLVKRQTHGGRSGKLFYRGCLTEGDVEMAGDGRFTLTAGGQLSSDTGANFVAYLSRFAPFLLGGTDTHKLCLISTIGVNQVAREVEAMHVGGVTISRRNHRYFDRAAV